MAVASREAAAKFSFFAAALFGSGNDLPAAGRQEGSEPTKIRYCLDKKKTVPV